MRSYKYPYSIDIYDGDDQHRFLLGKSGTSTIVVIGINPSTANKSNADATIKSFVIPIIEYNGYDGWLMVNPYAQIATDATYLDASMDGELHQLNLKKISGKIAGLESYDVWCAWGTLISKRDYLKSCLTELQELLKPKAKKWLRIEELNNDGTPKHPLIQGSQTTLIEFIP
jgi:hypothetical protein